MGTEKDPIGTKYKAFQKEMDTCVVLPAISSKGSLLGQGNCIKHRKLLAGVNTNYCW